MPCDEYKHCDSIISLIKYCPSEGTGEDKYVQGSDRGLFFFVRHLRKIRLMKRSIKQKGVKS